MLPLVSTIYASSETTFGLNLNPLCKPEDVSYTIMPNVSFFEFIPLDGDKNDVVDLADLKLGCSYELVVTNFSGELSNKCLILLDDYKQNASFYLDQSVGFSNTVSHFIILIFQEN